MENIKIITIDRENIDNEHICCALDNPKHADGVRAKKAWMKNRFDEGLVFKKTDIYGKTLIQYVPAEKAWAPIEASGYLFIECFWVEGIYAGKGIGKALFQECLHDSKNTNGIAVLVGQEKKLYLNDKLFFKKMGFEVCDRAEPYFELMVLKNNIHSSSPKIKEFAKNPSLDKNKGITIYYSDGCPYIEYYTKKAENLSTKQGIPFTAIKISSTSDAQNSRIPFTIHSVFLNGKFICHETFTEATFEKMLIGN